MWVPWPPTDCFPDGASESCVEVHRMPGGRYDVKGSKCSKTCHKIKYLKKIVARHLIESIECKCPSNRNGSIMERQHQLCDTWSRNLVSLQQTGRLIGSLSSPVLCWQLLGGWPHEILKEHMVSHLLSSTPSISPVITRQKHSDI